MDNEYFKSYVGGMLALVLFNVIYSALGRAESGVVEYELSLGF